MTSRLIVIVIITIGAMVMQLFVSNGSHVTSKMQWEFHNTSTISSFSR